MARLRDNDNLIGESNNFLEVLEQVSRAATLHKPVLIIGERGTGKELIAARLHFLSSRWQQPYLQLNCAALNDNLLESELFGHESGAFTGASKRHEGRFERAHQGTLFLDELANTSSLVQEKLLRVIEYGEFERVGGSKPVRVDVRLIAATNEDLPSLVAAHKFRADLLDRLAFDVITLPPLRERQEDILLLAEHFAIQMAQELGLPCFPGFSATAQRTLLEYPWPGNVRELKNVIERSLYRTTNPTDELNSIIFDPFASPWRPIANTPHHQRPNTQDTYEPDSSACVSAPSTTALGIDFSSPIDFKEVTQQFEISVIEQAMQHCQFNQKKTAELLGLSYHQLRGYLKKYTLLSRSDDEADN